MNGTEFVDMTRDVSIVIWAIYETCEMLPAQEIANILCGIETTSGELNHEYYDKVFGIITPRSLQTFALLKHCEFIQVPHCPASIQFLLPFLFNMFFKLNEKCCLLSANYTRCIHSLSS